MVTVGVYDGVHRGHRALLRRLSRTAVQGRARAVVVTFQPHPRCVLDPPRCPAVLTPPSDREALLRAAGADLVLTLQFTPELSQLSAEGFCHALVEALHPTALVEGPGFALGNRRSGDLGFLRKYGVAHGFEVVEVPGTARGGVPISASRIRAALASGRIAEANAMLGRAYGLSGRVVAGERVGRRLGFPTANLAVGAGRCVPLQGVYAGWFEAGDGWRRAAVSIGVRPTFGDANPLGVEAHLLDFSGDLYGSDARVAFVRRLRGERRFPSEAALRQAMTEDVEHVRALLRGARPPA